MKLRGLLQRVSMVLESYVIGNLECGPNKSKQVVYTNICDFAMFCALHAQLVSVDRHAQLTRCFSAVAELLVLLPRDASAERGNATVSRPSVCPSVRDV